MAGLTLQELRRARWIGVAGLAMGILMAAIGVICIKRGIGTPEYIISLKNSGWTLLVVSACWTVLAFFREHMMRG